MPDQQYADVPLTTEQAKGLGYDDIPTSWTTKFPKTAAATKAALGALPAIGGIVGGALSTPETGGAGTIPGMALGAGAGRGLQDLITEAIGLEPKSSPLAKAGRIGVDTVAAATTAGTMKIGSRVIEAAAENPTRTLGEFLRNVLSPRQTGLRVAKEMIAHEPDAGAMLQRPAWQTWSGPAIDAPKLSARDFLNFKSLVKQGVSEMDALKTIMAAKAGAARVP